MKIFDCVQGSPEWFELHRGRVSGSQMNRILTPAKAKPSASQKSLICEMIGQALSPYPMADGDGYMTRAMMEGKRREPESRCWYELEVGENVDQVGFIASDCERWGVSPDGLMPNLRGGLELKNPSAETHAEYLMDGVLPLDHRGQCHAALIVTGYDWWDFVSYHPGMDPFRIRVTPNEYTEALRKELDAFWVKYQEALAKVRGEKMVKT